ncbi:MAG: hypothetical protein JNM56_27000 [Planctomycetia bacterium]|nr:hypothetical protein [Planctomycetia bacterium]
MTRQPEHRNGRQAKQAGISAAGLLLTPVVLFLAGGCRNCDQVESELRRREVEVHELRCELETVQGFNDALHRELGMLRQEGKLPPAPAKPSAGAGTGAESAKQPAASSGIIETISIPNTVKEIVLNRQTGGIDTDRCSGDDGIQVVIEPRDHDGHALKVPANLVVSVQEILPEGLKRPLSTWEVSDEQLRRSWKSGLFGSGFYVTLPWKCPPSTEKLRVTAQLTLADSRLFEADRDITVRLLPEAQRQPIIPPTPTPHEELPLPRRAEKPNLSQTAGVQLLRPE